MLTELIELGCKMKNTQNGIKQNIQGTNSDRKETRSQINYLEQKEEISIQPERNEETRIQNDEEKLRNSGTNLNIPTSELQGCQKEKKNSKKLKTYLNK